MMTVVRKDATLADRALLGTSQAEQSAPGWPGLPARWTSSAKSGIGTAISRDSRIWFTLNHGILNETDRLWSSADWISADGGAWQGAIHVKLPRWDR